MTRGPLTGFVARRVILERMVLAGQASRDYMATIHALGCDGWHLAGVPKLSRTPAGNRRVRIVMEREVEGRVEGGGNG